jgi:hypothetical protein
VHGGLIVVDVDAALYIMTPVLQTMVRMKMMKVKLMMMIIMMQ